MPQPQPQKYSLPERHCQLPPIVLLYDWQASRHSLHFALPQLVPWLLAIQFVFPNLDLPVKNDNPPVPAFDLSHLPKLSLFSDHYFSTKTPLSLSSPIASTPPHKVATPPTSHSPTHSQTHPHKSDSSHIADRPSSQQPPSTATQSVPHSHQSRHHPLPTPADTSPASPPTKTHPPSSDRRSSENAPAHPDFPTPEQCDSAQSHPHSCPPRIGG